MIEGLSKKEVVRLYREYLSTKSPAWPGWIRLNAAIIMGFGLAGLKSIKEEAWRYQ